jgi:predicted MFS family arabinose efflux permease
MQTLLEPAADSRSSPSLWKNPAAWLRDKQLSRGYWTFFAAAFFFDAGFAVYVFLFNLFLLDCHYNERTIGWIGGAMTLGSVLGTLPTGALVRRRGLRPVLLALFIAAPVLGITRALWISEPAQIALALLEGLAMSSWGVCFLPAIARLTTKANRTSAFSFIFSVSIGTGILGGIVCGYLGPWLTATGLALPSIEVKRIILIASCLLVFVGLIPVWKLRTPKEETNSSESSPTGWLRLWTISPFLARFLPAMALWCAILAAFTPFANIYLTRQLHISIETIGLLFSTVQLVQLGMGIITPILFRILGLVRGIVATQIAAAAVLALLAVAHNAKLAIALYLIFSAAQWMSSPGLFNLLMNATPDRDRSTAAAMTLFSNALAGSAATAIAGALFTRFGYPPVLLGIAAAALSIALFFLLLVGRAQGLSVHTGPEST